MMHDLIVAALPEGSTAHVEADCPVCGDEEPEAGLKTYTEDEFKAAVAEATQAATDALRQRVSELEGNQAQASIDAAIAEAKAAADAQIAELQASLDAKVLEAKAASDALAARNAEIEAEKETARLAAEATARQEARVAEVAAIVEFPEEHVTASAERWGAMSDADWATQIGEFKAIAARIPAPGGVRRTAMTAAADTRPAGAAGRVASSELSEVLALRDQGINVRSV